MVWSKMQLKGSKPPLGPLQRKWLFRPSLATKLQICDKYMDFFMKEFLQNNYISVINFCLTDTV